MAADKTSLSAVFLTEDGEDGEEDGESVRPTASLGPSHGKMNSKRTSFLKEQGSEKAMAECDTQLDRKSMKKKSLIDNQSSKEQYNHEEILQPLSSSQLIRTTCNICLSGDCQRVSSRTKQMGILIAAKKPHEAQSIFDALIEQGHKPTLVTYTTLITSLTDQRLFNLIPPVISQVEENELKPDSIYFNAVINAFSEAGRISDAIKFFWKMKESGCTPTISTFNTLIKGYGIVGKPEESQKLFNMMPQGAKAKPNHKTYNILIKVWCDQKNLSEAWNVIYKMCKSGMRPDIVTYNTLARAYAKNGETKKAEELILDMETKLRPNERSLATIVDGYCREGKMEDAWRCLHRLKDLGVRPNVIVFNTLIKGFLNSQDIAGVDQVLVLMEALGVKPDIVTYSHQMNAWAAMGLMPKCMEIFDAMLKAGVKPDAQVYSILAKGYVRARETDKAEALLTTMEELGIFPNVVTFTTIISGWCSAANMENAMRVYKKMCECGASPNIKTFDTLIWGFGDVKQPWKAEEMLQAMREAGVLPKNNTLQLVANAWTAVGLQDEASRVIRSATNQQETRGSYVNGSAVENVERQNLGSSSSSLLQIPNLLSDGGVNGSKIVLQDAEISSENLRTITKSVHLSGMYSRLKVKSPIICRKQCQVQLGAYGQVFNSCKVVFLN